VAGASWPFSDTGTSCRAVRCATSVWALTSTPTDSGHHETAAHHVSGTGDPPVVDVLDPAILTGEQTVVAPLRAAGTVARWRNPDLWDALASCPHGHCSRLPGGFDRGAVGRRRHASIRRSHVARDPDRLPPHPTGRPVEEPLEIKEAQQLAWANKIAKGFNTTDVPLEFMLLQGEIAESFQAWRRAQPDLGEELADVALYLFALAEMNGVDLDNEIVEKIAKNAGRRYIHDSNGVLFRVSEGSTPPG
jgi:NTP pyrophosphatase (non-canonical NTP hydrolase)